MINSKKLAWVAGVAAVMLISLSFRTIDETPGTKDAKLKEWERAKAYTKEYLDAATEETYAFKPTADMRSFGAQMLHLADANYGLVSAATGKVSPSKFGDLEKGSLKTKAEITKAVMDSYDFVFLAIKETDDAKMTSAIKFRDMDTTPEIMLDKAFEHQTHHRGQTTVYLRLKGITPPKEKLF